MAVTEAEAPAAQTVAEKVRRLDPLEVARMKETEFMRKDFFVIAGEGVTPQDLLQPEYWANQANRLTPHCRVECWANDGSWMVELVVLGVSRNAAQMHPLHLHRIQRDAGAIAGAQNDATGYELKHRGMHSKWSVIRKADNAVVHEGEATKAEAEKWLTEHLKAFK